MSPGRDGEGFISIALSRARSSCSCSSSSERWSGCSWVCSRRPLSGFPSLCPTLTFKETHSGSSMASGKKVFRFFAYFSPLRAAFQSSEICPTAQVSRSWALLKSFSCSRVGVSNTQHCLPCAPHRSLGSCVVVVATNRVSSVEVPPVCLALKSGTAQTFMAKLGLPLLVCLSETVTRRLDDMSSPVLSIPFGSFSASFFCFFRLCSVPCSLHL